MVYACSGAHRASSTCVSMFLFLVSVLSSSPLALLLLLTHPLSPSSLLRHVLLSFPSLSLCLCKALCKFPDCGQYPRLWAQPPPLHTGPIPIMSFSFLGQIFTTVRPHPTQGAAMTPRPRGEGWRYWCQEPSGSLWLKNLLVPSG